MTVLATDDFNRANSADLGTSWDVVTGNQSFQITSNAATPLNVVLDAAESYNAVTWPNDQYSQVLIPVVGTGVLGSGTGVGVRISASVETLYRIVVSDSGSEMGKFVTGTFTQLATNSTVWANGDTAYTSVVGTTLQVKRNGTNLYSGTDSAIASGRAGITHSSTSQAGVNVDNWEGGDFVGAGRTTRNTLAAPLGSHLGRGLWTHGGSG